VSKKQDIKRCLQVDNIDTIVRVNECTRIKYSLCFYFIRTPISFLNKNSYIEYMTHDVIYNLQNWAHYANQKASPDVCTPSTRSNAKRLLFYLSTIPATCLFNFVIFLKYFEILWYSIAYLRHVSKLV